MDSNHLKEIYRYRPLVALSEVVLPSHLSGLTVYFDRYLRTPLVFDVCFNIWYKHGFYPLL